MQATRRLVAFLATFNDRVGRAGVFVASCFIALMTLFVIAGVFFRYVLNDSIGWVEDVSLILMVTTAFLVAPFAYRTGGNVAIEFVVDHLPKKALRGLRILINVLILWIIYRYFYESLNLVARGWSIRVNTVPIAWAWPYMAVPAAFAAMALVGFELILRDLFALATGSSDLDLPHYAPQEPE